MKEDDLQNPVVAPGTQSWMATSVRKVYAEQKKSLTQELARLDRERQLQAQADDLRAMLESYRAQHRARATLSAGEALRFRRFYERMTDAVGAQEEFVNRLSLAVEGKQAEWRDSYRQRRALELVLEKRPPSAR
jgi:flagellar biosynthesis chaperone FliJ